MVHVSCFAKLNLTLHVTGTRSDGFHNLESVFQTISLYDTLELRQRTSPGFFIQSNVSIPGKNLIQEAAELFFRVTQIPSPGLSIYLEKRIPMQAGLGGGSADAAGTLLGLCKMYSLQLSPALLRRMALSLGADVPFLLQGGCAVCSGIGERVEPIVCGRDLHFVVVKPSSGLSTKAVFSQYDAQQKQIPRLPTATKDFVKTLCGGDLKDLAQYAQNDLASPAIQLLPEIEEARQQLLQLDAIYASMTGSGSAVFGLFASKYAALRALDPLSRRYAFAKYAFSVPYGVSL